MKKGKSKKNKNKKKKIKWKREVLINGLNRDWKQQKKKDYPVHRLKRIHTDRGSKIYKTKSSSKTNIKIVTGVGKE